MMRRQSRPQSPRGIRPHPQVVFTELADGTGVLLHLTTKFFFSLNPTSTFLWKRLARGASTKEKLVSHLLRQYQVVTRRAKQDVGRFLIYLRREELLIADDTG